MWTAMEKLVLPVRSSIRKKIVDGVHRLKQQVEGKLKLATVLPPVQQTLFKDDEDKKPPPSVHVTAQHTANRSLSHGFPKPMSGFMSRIWAVNALQQLPGAAKCSSIDVFAST